MQEEISNISKKEELQEEKQEEKVENETDRNYFRIILGVIIIIILLLGVVIAVYLSRYQTQFRGRAYTSSTSEIELANSYLFASPLKAEAGGVERIRITVFILDSQGKGVSGKKVLLGNAAGVVVESIQSTTDDIGRALFDISSTNTGLYLIEASVEGGPLPQKITITFD
ncbi:Ig-like domain-containing protein [Patescibacteria group bacterium]